MNKKALISLLFFFVLLLSLPAVQLTAAADDYIPEILPAPAADGSLVDGEALRQFFDNYLKENNCDGEDQLLSIAVWYPGTGEYWYYNAEEWMYGVNWYRLPVSMYLAEKVSKGELTMDTVVNGIQLEYAITTALEASSNPSASSMVLYLGGNMTTNCADLTKGLSNLPDSYFIDDYYQKNAYNARLMLEITKTLYLGGAERFPLVEESMKKSTPEDFFKRDWDVRHTWEIAQTHAAYWGDGAGDRVHCTGIIYTPTPLLLTVMTKNIADLDIIGGIGWRMSHLAAALDARLKADPSLSANAAGNGSAVPAVQSDPEAGTALSQDTQAADVAPAEITISDTQESAIESTEDEIAPNAAAPDTVEEAPLPSPVAQEENTSTSSSRNPFTLFLVLFVVFFIAVVSVAVWLMVRENRQRKRRRRRSKRS